MLRRFLLVGSASVAVSLRVAPAAPRRGRCALRVAEARDMDELLRSVVGAGTGMGAARRGKGSHRNKYKTKRSGGGDPAGEGGEALDPWAQAVEAAARDREERENATAAPTYALKARCFAVGAEEARSSPRRAGRVPDAVLDFDARDPSTFGFREMGTVVGAHGVRGGLRVDAFAGDEDALLAPGLRHLRLASRRSPRPVVVRHARVLKTLGAKTRYVVDVEGLTDRFEAAALRGAVLYARDVDLDVDDYPEGYDDAYAPSSRLLGLKCVDANTGAPVGVVVDVLDPNDGHAVDRAPALLELELDDDPTYHCLVPLAPECLPDVGADAISIDAPQGLLDLAFKYVPPPPVIKGLLEPPDGAEPPPLA